MFFFDTKVLFFFFVVILSLIREDRLFLIPPDAFFFFLSSFRFGPLFFFFDCSPFGGTLCPPICVPNRCAVFARGLINFCFIHFRVAVLLFPGVIPWPFPLLAFCELFFFYHCWSQRECTGCFCSFFFTPFLPIQALIPDPRLYPLPIFFVFWFSVSLLLSLGIIFCFSTPSTFVDPAPCRTRSLLHLVFVFFEPFCCLCKVLASPFYCPGPLVPLPSLVRPNLFFFFCYFLSLTCPCRVFPRFFFTFFLDFSSFPVSFPHSLFRGKLWSPLTDSAQPKTPPTPLFPPGLPLYWVFGRREAMDVTSSPVFFFCRVYPTCDLSKHPVGV